MAELVASWSKDPSTQTGAVIVAPDRSIVSLGFNGFARKMSDDPALYADRDKKYSRIIHCEVNAVLQAKRSVEGCILYTYPFASCDRCAVQMIQAGITHFVFPELEGLRPEVVERWKGPLALTKSYLDESKLCYTEVPRRDLQ